MEKSRVSVNIVRLSMHLLDRITQWSRLAPDRLAHVSENRSLTWRDLEMRSNAFAAWLDRELGESRAPIVLRGHKEPEMLIAFLGAVKSGRPYVPVDRSIPAQRVERIVTVSQAARVLTAEDIAEVCTTGNVAQQRRVQAHDPFYILFTSGSTGEPKGVVITLANLEHFVGWMLGEHRFAAGEVFLNQAPFSFDLSVMDTYLSLATGGTLFSITKNHVENPKTLYEAFRQATVTTWVSTPSFAAMCLVERTFNQAMLPALRRFLFCGETLASETAAQLLERFPGAEVWNTYGPTEATVATTSIRITREIIDAWNPLPVGVVMPGTAIELRGEDGSAVASSERGEIIIAGPNVSPGYLGREELTARAFFDHDRGRAYRTGDWGRERDGLIFFEGRIDEQIKLHGFRIELGDLEANLRALPEISDAAVLTVLKAERVDSLAAFVVLAREKIGSDFEVSAQLKAKLAERLPAYMIPRKFLFLDAFPITPNGKIDRRALAERLLAPRSSVSSAC
jgi:D-alanine--poly(phosphoribitol) ligase subunit 1